MKIFKLGIVGLVVLMLSSMAFATEIRLPVVGDDSGAWGTLLNDFLDVSFITDDNETNNTNSLNGLFKDSIVKARMINTTDIQLSAFTDDVGYALITDLEWTNILNIPAGIEDGDDDTVYDDTAIDGRVTTLEGAGYITDGNTLWDNTYGFITNAVNDLSNYYLKTDIDTMLSGKQDTLDGTETVFDGRYDAAGSASTAETNAKDYADDNDDDTIYTDVMAVSAVDSSYPNLDTDSTDDFDGDFSSLTGVPSGFDDGDDDTQLTEAEVDDFVSDNGYLTSYTETDPVFIAWDKDYADLSNTPSIPTKVSELENDEGYVKEVGATQLNGTLITYNDQASSFRLKGVCDSDDYSGDDGVYDSECQSYSGVFYNDAYDDTGSSKSRTTRTVFGSNSGMDFEIQGSNDVRITAVDNNNLGAEVRIAASGDVKIHADVTGAETDNLMATFNNDGAKFEVGGSANKVVCWKDDGKTIGYCSDAPIADGSCTCN